MSSENLARNIDDENRSSEPDGSGERSSDMAEAKRGPVVITYEVDQDDRHYFEPAEVHVREGESLVFEAHGTDAIVFFPQADTIFGDDNAQVLGVTIGTPSPTPVVQEGAARDEPYEYVIFCKAAGGGEDKSLGQFAEGNSTPKIMIEPPDDDGTLPG
jgi:hypothetical protein